MKNGFLSALTAVAIGLASTSPCAHAATQKIVFEGAIKHGSDFKKELPGDLVFTLTGRGTWMMSMFHKGYPEADLVFAVNPPYRKLDHLQIGSGYGVSARESVANTPRSFAFLYRKQDAAKVSDLLVKILWPKGTAGQDHALATLKGFPKGKGKIEILSAELSKTQDQVENLKFRVTLEWPKIE